MSKHTSSERFMISVPPLAAEKAAMLNYWRKNLCDKFGRSVASYRALARRTGYAHTTLRNVLVGKGTAIRIDCQALLQKVEAALLAIESEIREGKLHDEAEDGMWEKLEDTA